MSKEAIKLALEALEGADIIDCDMQDAITALQQALAEQPAQPYKSIADYTHQATNGGMRIDPVTGDVGIGTPSPPAQRTWVGLLWGNLPEDGQNHDFLRGAVWAEAKLKELNT